MRILKWTCGSLFALFVTFLLLAGVLAYVHSPSPSAIRSEMGPAHSVPAPQTPEEEAPEHEDALREEPLASQQEASFDLSVKEMFFRKVPDVGWVSRFSHASDLGDPIDADNGKVLYSVWITEEIDAINSSQDAELEVLGSRDGGTVYSVTSTFGLNENNGPYLLPDDSTGCYVIITKIIGAISPDCEELASEAYHRFTQPPFHGQEVRSIQVCNVKIDLTVTSGVVGADLKISMTRSEE